MSRPYPDEQNVVRYTKQEIEEKIARGEDRTDWQRVEALRDEDIVIDADAPEMDDEAFARGKRWRGPQKAPTKVMTTVRLDRDVLAFFKRGGRGWQTRINEALRKVMEGKA